MGFATAAEPAVKTKPVDPNETDDPTKMSWKRYVAWREEQEEKKRGRKAPIFPKRKNG
jgi:hypothetical protein